MTLLQQAYHLFQLRPTSEVLDRMAATDWLLDQGVPVPSLEPSRPVSGYGNGGGDGYGDGNGNGNGGYGYGNGDGNGYGYGYGNSSGNGSGNGNGNGDGDGNGNGNGNGVAIAVAAANQITEESMKGELWILHCSDGNDVVARVWEDADNPMFLRTAEASVIRLWGTTQGLGQLASQGPLAGTRLDRLPDEVSVNVLKVIFCIPCNEAAWARADYPKRQGKTK